MYIVYVHVYVYVCTHIYTYMYTPMFSYCTSKVHLFFLGNLAVRCLTLKDLEDLVNIARIFISRTCGGIQKIEPPSSGLASYSAA